MKTVLATTAIFLAISAGASQQKPDAAKPKDSRPPEGYSIPAEDAQRTNPVKPTEGSIAAGGKFYSSQCAMCHGKDGDGKGDLAVQLELKMRDYRQPESLAKFTDGELFYIITNGRGKMTGGEGDRTSEEVRWNLVNVVRAFAKKDAAEKR